MGVVDFNFDTVDHLHSFLFGLDLLGSELGFRGNEGYGAHVGLGWVRVGRELDRSAEVHVAEVGFADVGAQPRMIDIADADDGGAGGNDFTGLRGFHENDAVDGARDDGVGELRLRDASLGASPVDFRTARAQFLLLAPQLDAVSLRRAHGAESARQLRAGARDFFLAGTLFYQRVSLLR